MTVFFESVPSARALARDNFFARPNPATPWNLPAPRTRNDPDADPGQEFLREIYTFSCGRNVRDKPIGEPLSQPLQLPRQSAGGVHGIASGFEPGFGSVNFTLVPISNRLYQTGT